MFSEILKGKKNSYIHFLRIYKKRKSHIFMYTDPLTEILMSNTDNMYDQWKKTVPEIFQRTTFSYDQNNFTFIPSPVSFHNGVYTYVCTISPLLIYCVISHSSFLF